MSWQRQLKKIVRGRVVSNEPLCRHTTFKIGGRGECWVEPRDTQDLRGVLVFARRMRKPVLVIGKGSNLLVGDKGVSGLAVCLNQPFFKQIEFVNNGIRVGAGLSLASLVNVTSQEGLSGCEFLAGIPGTVGGALLMNAGVRADCIGVRRYFSISDLVEEVEAMRHDGSRTTLTRKSLRFAYRHSNLEKFIVINTRLRLKLRDKNEIKKTVEKFWQHKRLFQEFNRPNAGCVFRNPQIDAVCDSRQPLLSAGQLIDFCGLKGLSRGGAVISQRHANFILNKGNARAKDVLELMRIMREKVKKRFNLELVPEIKIIGE